MDNFPLGLVRQHAVQPPPLEDLELVEQLSEKIFFKNSLIHHINRKRQINHDAGVRILLPILEQTLLEIELLIIKIREEQDAARGAILGKRQNDNRYNKYLKYKNKYLQLKKQ